ncbi:T-lymphocyte surface antigen Ly-9-like [Zonotrichia leucophrys gambelii]|uniref:T-lymphocyte surface antigen Ly-9-like n=1 Tax=Zonotrichia leucophrys gambelii TaxID=257770 RepID=UPI003140AE41
MMWPLEGRDGFRGILDLILGCIQRSVKGSHCWNASASDTTELIGVVSGSVTFHSHNPNRNVALWSFGSDPIVTVVFRSPPRLIFFEDKFKTRFAVRENGHALSIRRLRVEDAGTYSVNINRKTSTFTLQVFRKLAELTVTCEAQNCSDRSCSCCLRCSTPGDTGSKECFQSISSTLAQPRAESPMQEVNETSQDGLEPVTCTARNPVSSRDIVVTTPGCSAQVRAGDSWIGIGVGIIAGVEIALLLSIFLVSYRKYKCECGKPSLEPWAAAGGTWERDRARTGSQTCLKGQFSVPTCGTLLHGRPCCPGYRGFRPRSAITGAPFPSRPTGTPSSVTARAHRQEKPRSVFPEAPF